MGSGVGPLARATRSAKPTCFVCGVRHFCATRDLRWVISCGRPVEGWAPCLGSTDEGRSVWAELEVKQADRAISTGQLHALLRVHLRPIDVVVYDGS